MNELLPIPLVEPFDYLPIMCPSLLGIEQALELGEFEPKQRQWLMRRDTDIVTGLVRCQFVGYTREKELVQCPIGEHKVGLSKLHAHHIYPQGFWEYWFSKDKMGSEYESPNQPWNGIILCADIHHVGLLGIHPDYASARENYAWDKDGFRKIGERHHKMTCDGEIYWNDRYDQVLYEIAAERTETYLKMHPEDPWPEDCSKRR
jgi:hypothetical protein